MSTAASAAASAATSLTDSSGRTIVVDPNPMNEIMKRAEQLRSETTDGVIYPCEYCQKVFKFKYEYERHAKIHSGDRPWQCPECMKTFSRKDNMRAHMKIHTGELVRHVCQLCGKSYGRKYDLQVHERVHTGERPFECGSCGKSFISTSRLRAHQLIHCKNIYLPRHVRNKRLHLMKTGRLNLDSDSPTDSLDMEDYDEEDDEEYDEEMDEEDEDEAMAREEAAAKAAKGNAKNCNNKRVLPPTSLAKKAQQQPVPATKQPRLQPRQKKAQQQQQQQQQQKKLSRPPSVAVPAPPSSKSDKANSQLPRPTINLMMKKSPAVARHISICLVDSCCKTAGCDETDGAAACNDDYSADSPDAASFVDVAEKMRQLEAALMQRKAELEERGIKVETDSLLDVNSDLRHEDFHVVLPTDEACKTEPCD